MDKAIFILLTGFVLGIKHAFEADHMVAVSTIISRHKHPLKAALVGTFWGAGHTLTLFTVGILVLIFNISINKSLSSIFELFVGVMLILLGLFNLFRRKEKAHSHPHSHGEEIHNHAHTHSHHKSFLVGVVHGLDGSGALMLLVLSSIHSTMQGLFYILIFGIGSIISMSGISLLVGIPIAYGSKKIENLERYLQILTGFIGVGFGAFILLNSIFLK